MSGASGGPSDARRLRALRRAAAALGVAERAWLTDALLVAAAEAVERDPAFAERVRALLAADPLAADPLAADERPTPSSATPSTPSPTATGAQGGSAGRSSQPARLVPLARISDAELDPFGPPDPLYLYRLYGAEQLPTALAQYSYASLREAAARLFAGQPLPRGKAALIAAIVARVVEREE